MTQPTAIPDVTREAAASLRAVIVLQASTVAMQVVFLTVAARLLTPAEFGAFAAASIALRLVSYFADAGLGSAVVQADELPDSLVQQAVGAALLAGGALTAVTALLSAPAAALLDIPSAGALLAAISLSFLLTGAGTVHGALLRRRLSFGRFSVAEGVSYLVGYPVVGLLAALAGLGTWALVLATLTQATVRSVLVVRLSGVPWRPRRPSRDIRRLLRFGLGVSGIGFLEFWSSNLDAALIGRVLGASALGVYSRASTLVFLPAQYAGNAVTRVLLPVLARGDDLRARTAQRHGLTILAAVVVPAMAVAAAAAGPLVSVALGAQWAAAGQVLPVICAAVALNTLTLIPAVTCEARNVLRPKAKIQVAQLVVMATGLALITVVGPTLFRYGVVWLVAESVRHLLYLALIRRRFGVELRPIVTGYAAALAIAAPLVALAVAADAALPATAALIAVVIGGVVVVVAVLAAFPRWPLRRAVRELRLTELIRRPRMRLAVERVLA